MAIKVGFSDNNLTHEKLCFLMVAMALNWDLVLTQVVAMAPNQGHFKATKTASHWCVVPSPMVLASRGVFLDTQTLKKHPSEHPHIFVRNFLKCQSQAYN